MTDNCHDLGTLEKNAILGPHKLNGNSMHCALEWDICMSCIEKNNQILLNWRHFLNCLDSLKHHLSFEADHQIIGQQTSVSRPFCRSCCSGGSQPFSSKSELVISSISILLILISAAISCVGDQEKTMDKHISFHLDQLSW